MNLLSWLSKWKMTSLRINAQFLQMELQFSDADKSAAWELYIELLTRTTTQYLEPDQGDEKTALQSIYEIFQLTREVAKKYGTDAAEFTKIAIVVLNQVIRPFTSRWHKLGLAGAFEDPEKCKIFRTELTALQEVLGNYTRMLADMAEVEDLTKLERAQS